MLNYDSLKGKVAYVTADQSNDVYFQVNGNTGDCTSQFSWVSIFEGRHFFLGKMQEDCSPLLKYKVVLFSGEPSYLVAIKEIADKLKGKVITAFIPEGDVRLYDRYGINSFNKAVYEAWNACDVIFCQEEDKVEYYRSLTKSRVEFVHVPITESMEQGAFFRGYDYKNNSILMYCDNNPNCPLTVCAVASKLNIPIYAVKLDYAKSKEITALFGAKFLGIDEGTVPTYKFLELLSMNKLLIYPTRWIGTARMNISAACAGTACIGSDKSHTQNRLFPELACDIYDVGKMVELGKRLIKDRDFYEEIIAYAQGELSFYGMEKTLDRFYNAVSF